MSDTISNSSKVCLHCIGSKDSKVPRPLGEAIKSSDRNEVFHYDFMFVRKSKDPSVPQYILVIKDEISHYVELCPAATEDHFVVADCWLKWHKRLMGKNPCKWSRNTLEELSHREAQSYFSDGSTLYYGLLASKQRNSWKGQQGNSEDTEKSFFGITDAIESMVQIAFIDSECLEKLEVEITCTWSTNYCVPWIACA